MAPPPDHRRPPPAKDGDDEEELFAPSNTLWIGKLSSDTVDPDLKELFADHPTLDCTVMHGSGKTYAFAHFRTIDEARDARDALQGVLFHGSHVRIEFAKPARPFKHLWIGGLSLSTSKEQLEKEFLKFGKIDECKFFRDKNVAIMEFCKTEDAIAAQKNMNGKSLSSEKIRVDFLRPPARRELSDFHDPRNGRSRGTGPPEHNRHQQHGGRRDGTPSNVLWVGYPPAVKVDEQMLHNAMILFGEIENISCFPSRNYSFVQFRSTDEARRAKEGLQGRLFNDPRITIMFSKSTAPKEPSSFPGLRGPRPAVYFTDPSIGLFELYHSGRPVANNYSGVLPLPESARRFPPQGIDPYHGGSEYHEFDSGVHHFPDGDFSNPARMTLGRGSPSVPGWPPSGPDSRPHFRSVRGEWDDFDTREAKRSRNDGSPANDTLFRPRRGNNDIYEDNEYPHSDREAIGPIKHNHTARGRSQMHGSSDNEHYWRGILAKGGTHVCHARCVPLGKGIDSPLPEIINCSARTGLDMLTKHYAEATGFDIVFFLPDSEEDFAPYTEFLRYLGQKNRAGVAKLDDGTTLFLVPPSDFLSNVLDVPGPERLYGVVLRMPQQSLEPQPPKQASPLPPPYHIDRQQVYDSHKDSYSVSQFMDQDSRGDYIRPLPEDSTPQRMFENPRSTPDVKHYTTQSSSQNYVSEPAVTSQVGVSLTPELLATLASLLPNIQPSSSATNQMHLMSSTVTTSSYVHDTTVPSQGWRPDHQVMPSVSVEQQDHAPQDFGNQYTRTEALLSPLPVYNTPQNRPEYLAQSALGSTEVQNPSQNFPQPTAISTVPFNNYTIPSQDEQFLSQNNQHYWCEPSFASRNSCDMRQTANPSGVHAPFFQQVNSNTSAAPLLTEPSPLPNNQERSLGYPPQEQQLQDALSSFAQGTSEGDVDRTQRYQSTLQFAASLLQQLQQQQQASGQGVQGGNQH